MSYTTTLLLYWLKHRLTETIYMIIAGAITALIVLFFGKIILETKITYLVAWKWSWIVGMGISTLLSLLWLYGRYTTDHELAKKWSMEPKKILIAVEKYKIFKGLKSKEIENLTKEKFEMKLNIRTMVHEAVKNVS